MKPRYLHAFSPSTRPDLFPSESSQYLDTYHFEISLPPVFACHTTRMGLATNTDE
jgi:hypothetical protein